MSVYLPPVSEYKTGMGRVLFWREVGGAERRARGGAGCAQLENYSLPTQAERVFRYICLL